MKPAFPVLRIVDLGYAVVSLLWFGLPILAGDSGFSPLRLAADLSAASGETFGLMGVLVQIMVYAVPVIALWKLVSPLLVKTLPGLANPDRTGAVTLTVLSSLFLVVLQIIHAAAFAKNLMYFVNQPWYLWVITAIAVVYNGWALTRVVQLWGSRSPAYQEYLAYTQSRDEGRTGFLGRLRFWGIQRRLVVSFVMVILAVITVLCGILLNDFSQTILRAVQKSGQLLSLATASGVVDRITDKIGIEEYLDKLVKRNTADQSKDQLSLRFNSISVYRRDAKTENLTVVGSTDATRIGQVYPEKGEAVKDLTVRENASQTMQEFLAPITFGSKYLGFILVDYSKDVIYAPYYQTQVKVVLIGSIFVYISLFIIYLFGRNIVIPILFLRMSVNTIADSLTGMIRGNQKISAEALTYKDRVRTADEIKGLSTEIGNMTNVIRGIVPYISASTLKYAERESPSTEKKDLAFLFTDIRGFTTLCEGKEPEEVVELLNRYLDLQSSLILQHDGDIDKFVGDEIMGMFDGADKEINACRAGIAIRRAMAKEQEKARQAGHDIISIGIGINAGPVVFGSIGARDRMDFTSIGDAVNLAARLEGATKTYGTKTLISETVYEKVKDAFLCREIDLMTVKGKSKPSRIFEILDEAEKASATMKQVKEHFERGLVLYRQQKWDDANKIFTALSTKVSDETSAVFLKRIELFQTNPLPKDWDGVFNLTVK